MLTSRLLLCALALLVSVCQAGPFSLASDLENVSVKRTIDISTNREKVETVIEVRNPTQSPVDHYLLAIPEERFPHLAITTAKVQGRSLKTQILDEDFGADSKVKGSEGFQFVAVKFRQELQAGDTVTLTVDQVLTHVLSPLPAKIGQLDAQKMLYQGAHYFDSPYATKEQTTKFKLASSNVAGWSKKLKPAVKKGKTITYGPFRDIAAFAANEPVKIHAENNYPFCTMTKALREIEVSHWGNVAVEETYAMRHSGAELEGGFSRVDMTKRPQSSSSAFRSMRTTLPASVHGVYFRDVIGNISSSSLRYGSGGAELEMRPRYQLFGGWQTDFYFGYNAPAKQFLSRHKTDTDIYVLEMDFGVPFQEATTDELTVKVILPEGATDIQTKLQFPVDSQTQEARYTYLDTTGRPVVVLQKTNVVGAHNQRFRVQYRFSKVAILREPLFLAAIFALLFLSTMFFSRLNLSLDAPADSPESAAQVPSANGVSEPKTAKVQPTQSLTPVAKVTVKDLTEIAVAMAQAYSHYVQDDRDQKQLDKATVLHRQLDQDLDQLAKQDGAVFVTWSSSVRRAAHNMKLASKQVKNTSVKEQLIALLNVIRDSPQQS